MIPPRERPRAVVAGPEFAPEDVLSPERPWRLVACSARPCLDDAVGANLDGHFDAASGSLWRRRQRSSSRGHALVGADPGVGVTAPRSASGTVMIWSIGKGILNSRREDLGVGLTVEVTKGAVADD